MGSFFLLCDIYFDRLIQLMVDGDEIWEKQYYYYYYYYQAILYIFLMVHCLL